MRAHFVCPAFLLACAMHLCAADVAKVLIADGFDYPVGADGQKYYKARGYQPNGHLGEDWNGIGGGDTDLGAPVYCTAHGLVTFARDYKMGWGNVVIVRHAYLEGGETKFVDSLYGHLHEMKVVEGQQVKRGQLIGTIGTGGGRYPAHLHFEMRKDLRVGMFRNSFPRDFSVYWDPSSFIAARRQLEGGTIGLVPINTYPAEAPPVYAGPKIHTPATGPTNSEVLNPGGARPERTSPLRRPGYTIDRFEDLRKAGY